MNDLVLNSQIQKLPENIARKFSTQETQGMRRGVHRKVHRVHDIVECQIEILHDSTRDSTRPCFLRIE